MQVGTRGSYSITRCRLQESIHPPTTAVLRNHARQLPPCLKGCSGTVCADLPRRLSSFTQDFHSSSSRPTLNHNTPFYQQ